MDQANLYIWVMPIVIIIGLALTLVYYFARYYIQTHADDPELASSNTGAEAAPRKQITKGPTDLREALQGTRRQLWGRIETSIASDQIDDLEEVLFTSDMGPQTAQKLFISLEQKISSQEKTVDNIKNFMREEMQELLRPVLADNSDDLIDSIDSSERKPQVWLVVGVNGVGKTSTIGKLAYLATQKGHKVMIVAGDTFRAAADAQLKVWAERSGCEIFSDENTKDPAAIAYSALERAKAKGFDLVIVDTAGRLHTQDHLMAELQKVKKVLPKVIGDSPDETLMVLDANSGQNALTQAKSFNEALGLSGIVLTKMDGTSKGGVLFGISSEVQVPVRYIGIGEAVEDLRPFDSKSFVESII